MDIGITTTSEHSSFTGSFGVSFGGGGKGNIGATTPPATPSLTTTTGGTVVVGSGVKLTDSATLSGGNAPTGTITFTLYNGSTVVDTETAAVSGNGTYRTPNGYLPTAVGTYQWVASYGGDAKNGSLTDAYGSEPETVSPASPAIATTPSGTVTLGSGLKLTDAATLTGGYNPSGSIAFALYYNGGSTPVDTETVAVNGNGTYSTPGGYVPTQAGAYQWDASYAGDANNVAVSENNNANEQVTVNKASSGVSTAIHDAAGGGVTGALGEQVYDTATVTCAFGAATPTGTVTYDFYNTASPVYGVTTPVSTQTVTLSGGVVPAAATTAALTPGGYSFIGVYSGDSNYTGISARSSR